MGLLLHPDNHEYFSNDSPLFYKVKTQKGKLRHNRFFYRSALDNALKNNQLRAVQLIVNYICKYQNSFFSSYLFNKNFTQLFEKEIDIVPLLHSDVFSFTFDYDDWPSSHYNDLEISVPYNGSIFDIRYEKTY